MKKIFALIKKLKHKKVIRDYFSIAGVSFFLQPIAIIKGFVIANVLGPADYGILKTVELIQMLNKFGNLGFKTVANREMSNAIGEGDEDTLVKVRNTNYTAEIILSFILFFIGIISSFFISNIKIGLLVGLASTSLLISKIEALLKTESAIQKEFQLLSRVTFYTGLIVAVLVMILVSFLKVYAIFLVNIIAFSVGCYLLRKNLSFPFRFKIDKKVLKYSIKIGIPFTIATLSLGLYKYSERLLLVDFLGKVALGYFSFAMMVSNSLSILFKASIKVRLQDIWQLVGSQKFERLNKMVIKESLILTVISILIIPVIWIAIDFTVPLILPKYVDAIPIVRISTLIIPFQVVANYAGAVTTSKRVNNIKTPIFLRITSLLIFAGGAYYYFTLGELSLEKYAYLNLAGYAFYNIGLLVNYYVSFQTVYINK